jgi:tetratricopeptide (TPR) repeat protein
LIALGALVYNIPFVHDRLAWRLDDLRMNIGQYFNPPQEALFLPSGDVGPTVAPTPRPTVTDVGEAITTATPLPRNEPLPSSVMLEGVEFITQQGRWNYCGPSTLAMALNFWDWQGERDDIAEVIKPGENNPGMEFIQRGEKDKNVMPYEMEYYVNDYTELRALTRIGGEPELVKRLIANGFPVIIEKGYYEADYRGIVDWLGHYLLVTGYDDTSQAFVVQDTWDKNHPGENVDSPYEAFVEGWRSFNYLFIVVYPEDREAELLKLLGTWADIDWSNRHALEIAKEETVSLTGLDQYYAWFNLGSSHVALFEYVDAANAYDYAFQLYNALDDETYNRPYRMMWYQTGPYWAYYYSFRYQAVIDVANTTLSTWPDSEESLYWRGMARAALGETDNAIADFQRSVYLNPNFSPGLVMLEQMGVTP